MAEYGLDKRQVIATLRAHEKELKSAGVIHLRLFGSLARGDAGPQSDVDQIARFDKTLCRTLFDYAGVEQMISELLQVRVDLTPEDTMHKAVKFHAEHEAVLVF